MTRRFTRAIVRALPDAFDRSIRPPGSVEPIDVGRARVQHAAYVDALARRGLAVDRIDADERYPDCCFVEDPAVVVGDVAVVCAMAAPSRRGEGEAVAETLAPLRRIHRLLPPATMDGGDVILMGMRLFIGVSERTNIDAVRQVESAVRAGGYTVTPVEVRGVLHLKSACTPLSDDTLLVDPTRVDRAAFDDFRLVEVPAEEAYAANCLAVNGAVLVSAGFPETRRRIAGALAHDGVDTIEIDMGEFRKAGGSLTCLSILL